MQEILFIDCINWKLIEMVRHNVYKDPIIHHMLIGKRYSLKFLPAIDLSLL